MNICKVIIFDILDLFYIYNYEVLNLIFIFDIYFKIIEDFLKLFDSYSNKYFIYVVEENFIILGYGYFFLFLEKEVYLIIVEDIIYIYLLYRGKGIGK